MFSVRLDMKEFSADEKLRTTTISIINDFNTKAAREVFMEEKNLGPDDSNYCT